MDIREVFERIKKTAATATVAEKKDLRELLDGQIKVTTAEVQSMAKNLGGLTLGYREAWQSLIERRRQMLNEIEELRKLLD